jgi:integrase
MRSFVSKNDLPKVTPKGLRHTSATLLIMNGLNIRSLANRLGHAKTSTTTDIYSHSIKSMDEVAADLLDGIINTGK